MSLSKAKFQREERPPPGFSGHTTGSFMTSVSPAASTSVVGGEAEEPITARLRVALGNWFLG